MAQPFKTLGRLLSPNAPLGLTPASRSQLVQQLLAQSQTGPQGIVSPAGTANKALQGLLLRRAGNDERKENQAAQEAQKLEQTRYEGLAGSLSRSGQAGPKGEAARQASLIIAGGMPNNPLALALLGAQAKSLFETPNQGKSQTSSDLRTIANPAIRNQLGIAEDAQVEVLQEIGPDGKLAGRYLMGPTGRIDLTSTDVGAPIQRTQEVSPTDASKLKEAQAATSSLVQTVGDALTTLGENEDVNTWVARAGGIVNNLKQEATALGRELGINVPSLDAGTYSGSFDKLGIKNAQMRSLITAIAWKQIQSRQGSTSISNRDVQQAIEEIGGSARDADTMRALLTDIATRADRDFRTRYEVFTKTPFQGSLGLETLPQYGTQPPQDGGQDGATRRYPDGTTLTIRP